MWLRDHTSEWSAEKLRGFIYEIGKDIFMILDKFNLQGKTAIVTGASTGLGQGICLGLAEAGANIVGVDYVEMHDTEKDVKSLGRQFMGIVANLMEIKPIDEIVKQTVSKFGGVDILVNNAGIIRRCDVVDFSEKDWDDVVSINLKTVFFFCWIFLFI